MSPDAAASSSRLEMRPVLRRSWEVWRDSWGLFLAGAAIVQTPVALAAVAAAWATHIDIRSTQSWQYVTVAVVVALWATLGHHAVLAIAERIEAAQVAGQEPRRSRLLRDLPWRRLAIADVIVLVAVLAGITALVVPGVVLAVLLAPAFPLLTIEDRPVLATLKRSFEIVRHEFAPTLLLTGGAWAITQLAGVAVATLGETVDRGVIVAVVGQFATNIVLGSLGAVIVVITTFRLVEIDRARSALDSEGTGRGGAQADCAAPDVRTPPLPTGAIADEALERD